MPVKIKEKWKKIMPPLGETREGSLPKIDQFTSFRDPDKEIVRIKDLVK